MRNTQKMLFLGFLALSLNTYADPITSSSNASTASVDTSAAAGNTSNAQNINFNSAPAPTTTTIRTTGSANLGGFSGSFSSDYCGATIQAGLGGIGFGVSGGMPKIDNACVMLRTFERTQQAASAISQIDPIGSEKLRRASLAILAEIDPKVKEIFEKAGLVGDKAGYVGKNLDEKAKNKMSSDVKPNIDMQVDASPVAITPLKSVNSSSEKSNSKWSNLFN